MLIVGYSSVAAVFSQAAAMSDMETFADTPLKGSWGKKKPWTPNCPTCGPLCGLGKSKYIEVYISCNIYVVLQLCSAGTAFYYIQCNIMCVCVCVHACVSQCWLSIR